MQFDDFRISVADGKGTVTVSVVFPTGGWSNPSLNLVEYDDVPSDGVQVLTLTATPPPAGENVFQAFTKWPFPVSITFDLPPWFKGVRIADGQKDGGGGLMMAFEDFDIFPL